MYTTTTASRLFLPYCLDQVTGGMYVLLNRHYQPISMPMSSASIHEDRRIHFQIEGLTPEIAAKLSIHGDEGPGRIYFYGDGSAPWLGKREEKAYEQRIALLWGLVTSRQRSSILYGPEAYAAP